jgi:hypothetical protein
MTPASSWPSVVEQENELKDCAFEQMLWPFPDHQLGWKMRYAPERLTPQEFMRAAREMDAYTRLISMTQRRRNEICNEIQKGPNA